MRMDALRIAASAVWATQGRAAFAAACLLVLCGCNSLIIEMSAADKAELGQRALDLLERAAQDEADIVACHAIEALVEVAPQVGRPHFRAATRSESPLVRFAGCVALGETRNTAALDDVARCQRDAAPRVRLAAAFAAHRCGETDPQLLFQVLDGDSDENLRADAAYLIGRTGQRAAIPRLKRVTNDKSNKVVVLVYGAMARLGDKHALDQLVNFSQGDLVSRTIALQELAGLAREEARDALAYRVGPSEDYVQIRLIAAEGLGRLGSNAGFDLAMKHTTFTDKDETETMSMRMLAARALGAIGDARALAALQTLAESDDARVQVAACYAICRITRPAPKRAVAGE